MEPATVWALVVAAILYVAGEIFLILNERRGPEKTSYGDFLMLNLVLLVLSLGIGAGSGKGYKEGGILLALWPLSLPIVFGGKYLLWKLAQGGVQPKKRGRR